MNTALWWYVQNAVVTACLIPLVVLACRLFRHRPAVQHALWLIVLVKFLTPSVVVWPWDVSDVQRSITSVFTAQPEMPLTSGEMFVTERASDVAASSPVVILGRVLVVIWLVGALALAVRHLRRIRAQARLISQGTTPPADLTDVVRTVAGKWGLGCVPVLMVRSIASPFLWCLGRLKLIWPAQTLSTNVATPSIVAHELAHVLRRDHWVAWLELVASLLWWWNPLFWLVRRQLRTTSEMACDALALTAFPEDRCDYAETLLELSVSTNGAPALVLGVSAGAPSTLERRLSMIVSTRASGKLSPAGILLAGLLALVALPSWTYGQDDDDEKEHARRSALKRKMHVDDATLHKLAAALHKLAEAAHEGDADAAKKLMLIKELLAASAAKAKTVEGRKLPADREKLAQAMEKLARAAHDGDEEAAAHLEQHKRRHRELEAAGKRLVDWKHKHDDEAAMEGRQRKMREEELALKELELHKRNLAELPRKATGVDLEKLARVKEKLAQAAEEGDEEAVARLKEIQRKLADAAKERAKRSKDRD